MITNNGNLMCACDVETTGLDPEYHEVWQVAIIPLTFNLERDKTRTPFELYVRPSVFETMEFDELALTRKQYDFVNEHGLDPEQGVDMFDKWFEKMQLKEGRRIVPVAQNWKFDHQYMQKFMGFEHYNYHFDGLNRDTLRLALSINDLAEFSGEPIPFSRTNLSVLCKKLGVTLDNAHDALEDAYATAQVYKKLLGMIELR